MSLLTSKSVSIYKAILGLSGEGGRVGRGVWRVVRVGAVKKNELNGALVRKSISLEYCRKAHTHVPKSDVVWTDARSRGDHQLCDRHSLYYDKTILFFSNLFLILFFLFFFSFT